MGDAHGPRRGETAGVDEPTAVLIVEDHPILSEALSVRMEREGDLRVVGSTPSASQVLPMVAAARPDIVLLDIELGEDNGTDLIDDLRALPRGPKVVVLTCRTDNATAMSAISRGASAFVPKAAPMEELVQAIRTVTAGELWVSPAVLSRMLPTVLPGAPGTKAENRLLLLTEREREVLAMMVNGLPNAAIAERLHLSIHTVRTHVHNLQKKLNVHSKLAAVAFAHRMGIQPA
jgi:DNA-binding NarL/FixJ family response regulator